MKFFVKMGDAFRAKSETGKMRFLALIGNFTANITRDLANIASDVGDYKQNVGNITRDLANIASDVDDYKQNVDNITRDLANIASDVGGYKQNVGNITRNVAKSVRGDYTLTAKRLGREPSARFIL